MVQEKPVCQIPQAGVHFGGIEEVSAMQAWPMLAASQ
jgi:hypothetical protein